MSEHKVLIYSTPTCPYCKQAKDFFKLNNVKYTEVDVANDEKKAEEMIEKSGQMGVPVIDIDGQIIVGFDKGALKKALGLEKAAA
jgi:glutaredoxin 3